MKHMLSSAVVAGFAAGLLCALLQYLLVEPQILLAERYESGELVHFQATPTASDPAAKAAPGMDMTTDHAEAESGPYRHALTVLFAVLTYCGYGLVLVAGMQLAAQVGITLGLAQGILWGLAGFLAFQMMPALGLQPDLPGTPAADLNARQVWWAATAAATVIGLWFAAYGTAAWQRAAGVVVLVAPHVWGAPELDTFAGVAPPELAAAFATRTLGVGMITWMVLGGLVVTLWQSECR
jgi:cobalt transporter subunit CbtA